MCLSHCRVFTYRQIKLWKVAGERRTFFLFKYSWIWGRYDLFFQSNEVCTQNTSKSDGVDHYITELGLKQEWLLRERAETFSSTTFFPVWFLQQWQSLNVRCTSTLRRRKSKWKTAERTVRAKLLYLPRRHTHYWWVHRVSVPCFSLCIAGTTQI